MADAAHAQGPRRFVQAQAPARRNSVLRVGARTPTMPRKTAQQQQQQPAGHPTSAVATAAAPLSQLMPLPQQSAQPAPSTAQWAGAASTEGSSYDDTAAASVLNTASGEPSVLMSAAEYEDAETHEAVIDENDLVSRRGHELDMELGLVTEPIMSVDDFDREMRRGTRGAEDPVETSTLDAMVESFDSEPLQKKASSSCTPHRVSKAYQGNSRPPSKNFPSSSSAATPEQQQVYDGPLLAFMDTAGTDRARMQYLDAVPAAGNPPADYTQVADDARRAALMTLQLLNTSAPPSLVELFEHQHEMWAAACRATLQALVLVWCGVGGADVAARAIAHMDDAVKGSYGVTDAAQLDRILAAYAQHRSGALSAADFASEAVEALLFALDLPTPRVAFICNAIASSASANVDAGTSADEALQAALADEAARTVQFSARFMLAPAQAVVVAQRAVRRFLFRANLGAVEELYSQRKCETFRLLYKTEVYFVRLMNLTVKQFYVPLVEEGGSAAGVLDAQEVAAVYGLLPKLLIGHSQFLQRMERVRQSWPRLTGLPSLALESARLADLHVEYVHNSAYARQELDRLLRNNHAYRAFVRRGEVEVFHGEFELGALLAAPLNRMLSYESSYTAFLNEMPPSDPEYADMRRAYDFLRSSTTNLQNAIAEAPERARVLTAVARLGGFGAKLHDNPTRALLGEYTAAVTCGRRTRSAQHITIFTDVLVVARDRKKSKSAGAESVAAAAASAAEAAAAAAAAAAGSTSGSNKAPYKVDEVYVLDRAKFVLEEAHKDAKQQCSFSLLVGTGSGSEIVTFRLSSAAERSACVEHFHVLNVRTVTRANCSTAAVNPVFGEPLARLVERNGRVAEGVPIFVDKCIARLSQPAALVCEGIFRLSGSASRVAALRRLVEGAPTADGWDFRPDDDALAIASLLKSFLRELEDPLMTAELLPAFDSAVEALGAAESDGDQVVAAALPVLERLPHPNLRTFLRINDFLAAVAAHSAENKMDAKNLSIVFAPNIFIGAGTPGDMHNLFNLCTVFITHNSRIQSHFAALAR